MGSETGRHVRPSFLPVAALLGAALLGAALVSACAAPAPQGASPSVATLPPLTAPPGGATLPPSAAPAPTTRPPSAAGNLSCGSEEIVFPPEALAAEPDAPTDDAAAAALAAFVATGPAELGLPDGGWRRVLDLEDRVSFVAPGPDGWSFVTVARSGGGPWEAWEYGACRLAVVLPDGVGYMTWRLDPAAPPDPAATSVQVLANELACASGRPPAGRMLAPVVMETDDAVTIVLAARIEGGDCPSNPEVPVTVELAGPLGSRHLFDGSAEPPEPRD